MNRNQFNNKYSNFNIDNIEMERKWRIHEEEIRMLEEINRMAFARSQIAPGSTGYINSISQNSYITEGYIVDGYFQ